MRARRFVPFLVAGLLSGSLVTGPAAAGPPSLRVGTDPAGDWGANELPAGGEVGDLLGQDLVEASIMMADKETLAFVIKLNSLPASGGIPEFSRYIWEFGVDDEFFMLDGRFTNFMRGACDPTSGQCPPPRNPGLYPFIVMDRCGPGGTYVVWVCHEAGLVHADFDPSTATITVPVPLRMIRARVGSQIQPKRGNFAKSYGYEGNVFAAPAVWRTQGGWPIDALKVTRTFVVPRVRS